MRAVRVRASMYMYRIEEGERKKGNERKWFFQGYLGGILCREFDIIFLENFRE